MLFDDAVSAVGCGKNVTVDLAQNELRIGKKKINCRDVAREDLIEPYKGIDLLGHLKELYAAYRVSIPSERSERKRRGYFYAKPVEELTDEEMCSGEPRELARVKLETSVLCYKLNGQFVWPDDSKWFYRDGDFVLLKEWFE